MNANLADLEQGLLVASIGLAAWDAGQGQAILHLQVIVISLAPIAIGVGYLFDQVAVAQPILLLSALFCF
ncbi:MAG: hypothetical protein Q8M15_13460 [Bacteroidota bacterium]|nr:hypothetical protein [Bacteroidota bacterium]